MSAAEITPLLEATGLPPDERQTERLSRYLDLLQQWNGTYNLTAVRDRAGMLVQHLADCLAVVPALRRALPAGRILDVGSGGGLPGVVLAIMHPAWSVTCVDAVAKKAAFVRQAAGLLGLPNLHAAHARVEALQGGPFDMITSRAFASLPDFARLTDTRLRPAGCWVAMKGRTPDDEIADLPEAVEVFHVEQLQVPGLDAERCLVWMRRKAEAVVPPSAVAG